MGDTVAKKNMWGASYQNPGSGNVPRWATASKSHCWSSIHEVCQNDILILVALILCYLLFCCYTLALITVAGDFEKGDGYAMQQALYLFTWTIAFANSTVNPTLLYIQLTELGFIIKGFLRKLSVCRSKRNDFERTRNVKTHILLLATLGDRFPRD